MRIDNNGTVYELETTNGVLGVRLEKSGYDAACLEVISRYVEVQETDIGLDLGYEIGETEVSFRQAIGRATTKLEKLALAQKLMGCLTYRGGFKVPLIHPDTVYVDGDVVRVVHCGLQGMLEPRVFDEAFFLRSLQAMVLQVFRPKLAFEKLLNGARALGDGFAKKVVEAESPEELFAYISERVYAEKTVTQRTKATVSKRKYAMYRTVGVIGVVAALGAGYYAWQTDGHSRLQSAVVAAQASFLRADYAGSLDELDAYTPAELPTSAKYVLAVSSINLDDLTPSQKEAILNNISEKTDDNTLSYWIAIGRGDFAQALDRAQNIGDDQLVLFAYTDLYQATKLDTKMPGSKKQELLDKYAKAIDELTVKLTGTTAATGEAE